MPLRSQTNVTFQIGMAIAKDENLNLKNFQIKGTVRYLAPELLNFPVSV